MNKAAQASSRKKQHCNIQHDAIRAALPLPRCLHKALLTSPSPTAQNHPGPGVRLRESMPALTARRFLCPLAGGRAGRPSAVCAQANAALGTCWETQSFGFTPKLPRKDPRPCPVSPLSPAPKPLPGRLILISPTSGIRSGIWKTQFRAFEEAGKGYFSSKF